LDDVKHLPLDSLFLEHESILVPDEVGRLRVESVLLHAALEQANDVAVVWVLGETQASAVVHELSEFLGLVLAELIDCGLLLLLLDGRVFLSLGSA